MADENLDFGNDLPTDEELKDTTPPATDQNPMNDDGDGDGAKDGDGAGEKDDQPRDEKGRFSKDEPRIPKNRFDQVSRKLEESAARIRELESQIAQVSKNESVEKLETEISELEQRLEDARLDGNKEKAAELAKEVRLRERQIAIAESTKLTESAKVAAREEIRLDLMIEKLETEHPQFDPNAEDYDQDLVDETLFLKESFEARGMTPSAALERAVKYVLRGQEKPAESKTPGLAASKKGTDERKTEQVRKNVDAANRQPPATKDVGLDSDQAGTSKAYDINQMTAEEYSALPESVKARLRGDLI